jgi:kumamolisin
LQPSWQATANVPVSLNGGGAGRGVPDVAANASGASGYPLFVAGLPDIGNGTSASAPLYAGLWRL